MRRTSFILGLITGLLATSGLAACAPTATPPAAIQSTASLAPTAVKEASCTVESSVMPTPNPTELALYPAAGAADWALGPDSAGVTIIEYADFQCPLCSQISPILAQLHLDFPKDLRIIYRHYPLSQHDKGLLSAQAAEAAGLQGKFWEMHDLIFREQKTWAEQTPAAFESWLGQQAADLGLDLAQFNTDLKSEAIVQKVKDAQASAQASQLAGTPTLVINGHPYSGPPDQQSLSAIIQLTLMADRQFSTCPPMTVDRHKQYLATVKTEKGEFIIQLFADKAPVAVNSFIFLARSGWYDGVMFHRVVPDFIAQAGDPSGTGYGGPGYAFENEFSDLKFDRAGMVGMANAGPDSNGSQFFITYQASPELDGSYTVFGQVIQGMDVVLKLTPRNPQSTGPLPTGDKILGITIEEK